MYEKKDWKIQEGPGAEWARKGFSDGGFETGNYCRDGEAEYRLKKNPES